MRVLWITNTLFPVPSKALNLPSPVVGGWMYGLAERLVHATEIELAVAAVYQGREFGSLDADGIRYYLLPAGSGNKYPRYLETIWRRIVDEFNPTIVHIHGTEYLHGLACMRTCPNLRYIISIQGLVGIIGRYYYSGLAFRDIFTNITLRDAVRMDTIFQRKRKMVAYSRFEEEYLQRTGNVIGRTSWDYAHVKAVNPDLAYHHCNEVLREVFYAADKWDFNLKVEQSIFISQAAYPVKGLHMVLKAVARLVKAFPNITVRIAGHDLTIGTAITDRLRAFGYAAYISNLIKELGLEKRVTFTGPASEKAMVAEYQKAHVFICPSSIENSPNSVGEAQILGVPTIASFAGGIPDFISHGESGLLYRFEEIHMLVESIRRVFTDPQLAVRLSQGGSAIAASRHDREVNCRQLISIYRSLN